MLDYVIEKNIYLFFDEKDKEEVCEILGVNIENNEIELMFEEVELLNQEGFIDDEQFDEIEEEIDVTSYIIQFG